MPWPVEMPCNILSIHFDTRQSQSLAVVLWLFSNVPGRFENLTFIFFTHVRMYLLTNFFFYNMP